jgi:hypothetical protein
MKRYYSKDLVAIVVDVDYLIVFKKFSIESVLFKDVSMDNLNSLFVSNNQIFKFDRYDAIVNLIKDKINSGSKVETYIDLLESVNNDVIIFFYNTHITLIKINNPNERIQIEDLKFYRYDQIKIDNNVITLDSDIITVNDTYNLELIKDYIIKRT